jgi:hypothetical protein
MKKMKLAGGAVLWAFVASVAGSLSVNAQTVTMSLQDYTSDSYAGNDWIGVYQFNVSAADLGTIPKGNFWSVCLSPNGVLSSTIGSQFVYNFQNFDTAAPGLNGPAPWSAAGPNGGAGIQNAQYLWSVLGSAPSALSATKANATVGSTTVAEQGAGLAAAMYVALYDSAGLGVANTSLGAKYDPISSLGLGEDANVATDMNADLSLLNSTDVSNHPAAGYVLDPVDPNNGLSGQEFIVLVPNGENIIAAPEPASSGVIAGAFMLAAVLGNALRRKSP